MTPPCPREPDLLAALRANALATDPSLCDASLDDHLATCTTCRETQTVANLLLRYAADVSATAPPPPSPAHLWHLARQQRQTAALRRASRAMAAMQTLGTLYLLTLSAWLLRSLWLAHPAQAKLALLSLTAGALTTGTVPLGAIGAIALLLSGAAFLLLLGSRQQPPLLG